MSHALPAVWLAVLSVLAAPAALAQRASPAEAPAAAPAFRSAFDGYQAFADEPPIPWREANETVRARGGWKAYAREASDAAAPVKADPHAGHAMPMPPAKEPK